MVVCGRASGGLIGVKRCREWRPIDAPLEPTKVVTDALIEADEYGAHRVMTDAHARATLIECARAVSIGYAYAPANGAHWGYARRALHAGNIALPSCKHACACDGSGVCDRLVSQLRRVRVRIDDKRIRAEHTRERGAHGDIAEAWALALWQLRDDGVGDSVSHAIPSRFA
jgi:hypothetical protein